MRAGAEAIDQYLRAGDDAIRLMNAQDATLQAILNRLTAVEELTISAASEATSPDGREAIAVQLEEIRTELVELANTTHAGRSLVGGFRGAAVDDSGASVTLVADGGDVMRRIADDQVMRINVDAAEIFGFSGGRNLFDVIDDIIAETRTVDVASLGNIRLDELVSARASVNDGLGTIGSRTARVETTIDGLRVEQDELSASVADLVDVDLAEATVELSEANLAYESALAVTAQLNRISLLNYL